MMRSIGFMILVGCFFCGLIFGQSAGGEAAKPVGPKLWIESKAIDLGVIAIGEQEIKGVIPYMNDGDETLEVANISGSCDCFAGIEGEKVLAPGEDVWIGILLWDEGNCESNFFSHEISIDSTKPTITGTGR